MSGAAVLDLLQHGQPVQRLLTIAEGTPSILVTEKLAAVKELTGPVPPAAEGSILPDSYSYQRGETRAAVLKRMTGAMDKELAALWAKRKPTSVVKTPAEAVILASIVEKETGKAAERRTVAGVYSNRLRIGMKLDADPTVIYPITKGKPLGRRILQVRAQCDHRLQHLSRSRAAARADRQSGARKHRRGARPGADQGALLRRRRHRRARLRRHARRA